MAPDRVPAPILALDIGNVCLHVELQDLLAEMGFQSMAEFDSFDPDGAIPALCLALENGSLAAADFLQQFGAALPQPQPPARARRTWEALIGEEIDGMADLVRDAKAAGLNIVLMSDICTIHYDLVWQRLSFTDVIDGAVLSCQVGALKPEPPMYEAMEQQFGGGRAPLLFADDKEPNVAAARKRGWAAHVFRGTVGLRECLDRRLERFADELQAK